jgi:hypothetical protein
VHAERHERGERPPDAELLLGLAQVERDAPFAVAVHRRAGLHAGVHAVRVEDGEELFGRLWIVAHARTASAGSRLAPEPHDEAFERPGVTRPSYRAVLEALAARAAGSQSMPVRPEVACVLSSGATPSP